MAYRAQDKFTYRLTNWIPETELDEVKKTLIKGGAYEDIDWCVKRLGGSKMSSAVFTLGKSVFKTPTEI